MGNVCSQLCKSNENDDKNEELKATVANKHSSKQSKSKKIANERPSDQNKPTSQSGGHSDSNKNVYSNFNQNTPTGESQSHSNQSNEGIHRQRSGVQAKISTDCFDFLKYLGKGAYGKVALVKKKTSGQFYAMKIVKKKDFAMNRITIENAMVEREVLMKSHHPFVVKLKYSFQDSSSIYFVMDYVAGGQLFDYLKKSGKFDLAMTRFYAAEVLLGLTHLHDDLDTIYRDLKPENILVEMNGHIKLTDFGLSKVGTRTSYSICGTLEYLAPEIIESKHFIFCNL